MSYFRKFYNRPYVKTIRAQRRRNFKRDYPLTDAVSNNLVKAIPRLKGSVNMLKELVNTEFKFKDTDHSGAFNIDNTISASLFLLNHTALGDNESQRSGISIRLKSVYVAGQVIANSTVKNHNVRIMIVLDKAPNGVSLTGTNWLSAVLSSSASTTALLAPRNLTWKKRFVILKDFTIPVSYDNGNNTVPFKYYKKLNMHTIYNNGTNGDIQDLQSNALYAVLISDQGTSNFPIGVLYSRVRFIDN